MLREAKRLRDDALATIEQFGRCAELLGPWIVLSEIDRADLAGIEGRAKLLALAMGMEIDSRTRQHAEYGSCGNDRIASRVIRHIQDYLREIRWKPSRKHAQGEKKEPKCEYHLRLDIRELARFGHLLKGHESVALLHSGDSGARDFVRITVGDGSLRLVPLHRKGDRESRRGIRLRIERTACPYGGSRPWFRCPWCNARRAVLYGIAANRFGCRGCMNLVYASQDERKMSRLLRKERRIRSKLASNIWRPKGMHQQNL
jgi:hypothetical protein